MKLLAISDLHVGHEGNFEALAELRGDSDDWLILAGDVADTPDRLDAALEVLSRQFAQLIWVPGNHELWSLPRTTALRGVARYEALVATCRRRRVLTPEDPFPIWSGDGGPHLLAALFLLYDYTFRPDDVPVDDAVAWALASGLRCTDEVLLDPAPYASRSAWCAARVELSRARLADAKRAHRLPSVLISHFPLKQELAVLPRIPRFSIWCGTRATEAWHREFDAAVVVSGHLHIPRTKLLDGVRFEEVSLGYPRQWRARGRSARSHLRQILPPPVAAS